MNRVVNTSNDVRFTVTVALKMLIQSFDSQTQLKEEVLEEVGRINNGENEDGWKVDSQDGIQDPSLEDQGHLDSFIPVSGVDICERPKICLDFKETNARGHQLVMMYWVRTVWESMLRRWGVIAITEVSSFRTMRLTVHT